MEVTLETDQPDAVMELLLGFGASSASAMAANTQQATLRVVSAQFEGSSDILSNLDLEQIGSIIQRALDLPRKPLLKGRLLGGTWSKYFPLSESVEVRLPCHAGPRGGMLSETGRRVLRLEGGVAFGAGNPEAITHKTLHAPRQSLLTHPRRSSDYKRCGSLPGSHAYESSFPS